MLTLLGLLAIGDVLYDAAGYESSILSQSGLYLAGDPDSASS